MPANYLAQCGYHKIVKTVLIEGEWDPGDPMGELRWVDDLANREGVPHAMSAQAWLDREDLATLCRLMARIHW
ncbi:hypothetical protein [Caballeronia sordidicola]|nr:hypothetical protein [Caballeronia sordidicola]